MAITYTIQIGTDKTYKGRRDAAELLAEQGFYGSAESAYLSLVLLKPTGQATPVNPQTGQRAFVRRCGYK